MSDLVAAGGAVRCAWWCWGEGGRLEREGGASAGRWPLRGREGGGETAVWGTLWMERDSPGQREGGQGSCECTPHGGRYTSRGEGE